MIEKLFPKEVIPNCCKSRISSLYTPLLLFSFFLNPVFINATALINCAIPPIQDKIITVQGNVSVYNSAIVLTSKAINGPSVLTNIPTIKMDSEQIYSVNGVNIIFSEGVYIYNSDEIFFSVKKNHKNPDYSIKISQKEINSPGIITKDIAKKNKSKTTIIKNIEHIASEISIIKFSNLPFSDSDFIQKSSFFLNGVIVPNNLIKEYFLSESNYIFFIHHFVLVVKQKFYPKFVFLQVCNRANLSLRAPPNVFSNSTKL
ncbi:hypothetical protein [Halpernia frigidisoli]|uniref:Uncharacterized protein n=1 Tax=Halpernia frigidisoli TaxID=1125876 RepID=A0A1I3FMY1_9FLAO|nr:hypothetical protein [Halpernia frigidisoli]SFI12628.1 hypothetical protein SAMN05443292_1496 [Halpernia frigidisoli]